MAFAPPGGRWELLTSHDQVTSADFLEQQLRSIVICHEVGWGKSDWSCLFVCLL